MVRASPETPGGEGEDGLAWATVIASSAAGSVSPPRDFPACGLASSADELAGLEETPPFAVALADTVPEAGGCVAAVSAESAPSEEHGSPCALSADRCVASAQRPCAARQSASAESRDGASTDSCPAGERPHCQGPSSRRARRRQTQRAQRLAEREARRKAARFAEQLAAEGVSCPAAAALLQVVPRTLRAWRDDFRQPWGEPESRGRHCLEVDVLTRNEIFHFLEHITGPAVGLPALQDLFPKVPRCVLQDMLVRYRRVWRWRYAQDGFQLTWHHAGRVWAMDFTKPLQPIDGVFPYLLSIRDLASHCQLAWCPMRGQTAADVLPVLQQLFTLYGPPLVFKHDNGSAFLAAVTQQALTQALVAQLFSPPGQPQYNGAVERGNGVLKTYTHQHAQNAGHPFRWTSDDVEHAQQLANTISRPWGAGGLSPAQAWQQRSPITPEERQVFAAQWNAHRQLAAQELGLDLSAELSHADRARLDRRALSATLQDLGYLTHKHVRRAPQKPKRLTRKKLARRVAKYRRQTSELKSSAAENSTPPQSPEPAPAEAENSTQPLLAETPPSDTMLAASGPSVGPQTSPQEVPSAHRERTFTSWFRRTLTPLLPFRKTANISR